MSSNTVLSGSLKFISLGDLLQLLGSNGSTGTVKLKCRYAPNAGFIYLVDGNPIHSENGDKSSIDALYSLFGWIEGEFEFTEGAVLADKTIKKARMEIILDSLSMLDDGDIETLGPVTFEKEGGASDSEAVIPVIKGPLVDYMYVVDEEEFSDGEMLIQEGKHGGWIWVILEGVVEVVKESGQGPVKILRLGTGAFIGSIGSLLYHGAPRSATAYAVGDVQLGVIDSQRISSEYTKLSLEFKELVMSLDKRLKMTTNSAIEIHLQEDSPETYMTDRKTIMQQGEPEDRLFIITQGEASVIRKTEVGHVLFCNLDQNDFIGKLPFLDIGHEPDAASVYATEALKVNKVNKEKVMAEYNELSTTFKNLVENLAICVSVTSRLACTFQNKPIKSQNK